MFEFPDVQDVVEELALLSDQLCSIADSYRDGDAELGSFKLGALASACKMKSKYYRSIRDDESNTPEDPNEEE